MTPLRTSSTFETACQRVLRRGDPVVYLRSDDVPLSAGVAFAWGVLVGASGLAVLVWSVLVWP
jgi:hypothetical protein